MEESALVNHLRQQLEFSYSTYGFYRRRFDEAGITPGDIKTLDDFRKVPLMNRADQVASMQQDRPLGGLYHPKTTLICHTPSPQFGLLSEYDTERDLQSAARVVADHLRGAAVDESDIVQITVSYHIVVAGHFFQEGFRHLGAKVVPMGPGSTDRQIEVMKRLGTSVVVAFPSFAFQMAAAGVPPVKLVVCSGEPFSSIVGYREKLRAAWGGDVRMVDLYGTSGFGGVAMECRHERGMHVFEDWVYAEVIDPQTGDVLPLGERGELVLTHLSKEACPLVRFRTGDLTQMDRARCGCGRSLTLVNGVFGRSDEMYRVKGQKFYPSTVPLILAGVAGTSPRNFRLIVSRPQGRTDHVRMIVQGDPQVVDVSLLGQRLAQTLIIAPDELVVTPELPPGPAVVDDRGRLDR